MEIVCACELWRVSEDPNATARTPSIISRNGTELWGAVTREVDEHFVGITPTPALRRIVAFDDGMLCLVIMPARMPVRRVVTTAHMSADAAHSQMDPDAADLQAFFATPGARRDFLNHRPVPAFRGHCGFLSITQ
jgi:hypothetical protein